MIRKILVLACVGRIVCYETVSTAAAISEAQDLTDDVMDGFTSPVTLPSSDVVTASSDEWRLLERVRVFSTMATSYNWSARFDDRDREKTLTIVMSYIYMPGFYGSMSIQNGASYLTAAIEDYCRQDNNGLEDYYFEYFFFAFLSMLI